MVCYVIQEMCESELGKKIQLFRAERPDEWTMDEFIRDAEQQAQTIKELQSQLQGETEECDGLRAQVNEYALLTKEFIFTIRKEYDVYLDGSQDAMLPEALRNLFNKEWDGKK